MTQVIFMNKYFIIFLFFSFLALVVVGLSVYDSSVFVSEKSRAEGFGISPPYFKNDNLKPGETYVQTIRILRSEAKTLAKADIKVDAAEINSWITVEPGKTVNLKEGDLSTPIKISVKVPENPVPGNYRGAVYVTLITDENFSGVGIRTGAMAEINLKVIGQTAKKNTFEIYNTQLYYRLNGYFINVAGSENNLYYISPSVRLAIYSGQPEAAEQLIKKQGVGISNVNLEKIPIGLRDLYGIDTDKDGLNDNLEIALGTDMMLADSDGDGFPDLNEVANGYSPLVKNDLQPIDLSFAFKQKGRIFIQVENKGQAWYVNPVESKRYFLNTPDDTVMIIKALAAPISEKDFANFQR